LPPGDHKYPTISPDGKQVALSIEDGPQLNIWIYDLSAGGGARRLTFEGQNTLPLWTPDGKRVAFQSNRNKGLQEVYWQAADGSDAATRLTTASSKTETHWPQSWSPDGKTLLFASVGPEASQLMSLKIDGGEKPVPVVRLVSNNGFELSALSPDGRWLAYVTDESGQLEVYVQPYPLTGGRYQVSHHGTAPRWSRDGTQLFYAGLSKNSTIPDTIMAVPVRTQAAFTFGTPTSLPISGLLNRGYSPAPDGKQFLVVVPPDAEASPPQINVVLNWFEELKRATAK